MGERANTGEEGKDIHLQNQWKKVVEKGVAGVGNKKFIAPHNVPKCSAHSFVLTCTSTMMSRSSARNSYVAKRPLMTITCCRKMDPEENKLVAMQLVPNQEVDLALLSLVI